MHLNLKLNINLYEFITLMDREITNNLIIIKVEVGHEY